MTTVGRTGTAMGLLMALSASAIAAPPDRAPAPSSGSTPPATPTVSFAADPHPDPAADPASYLLRRGVLARGAEGGWGGGVVTRTPAPKRPVGADQGPAPTEAATTTRWIGAPSAAVRDALQRPLAPSDATVRLLAGAELVPGRSYETDPRPFAVEAVGADVPLQPAFAVLGAVSCHYDDLARRCVQVLTRRTLPAAAAPPTPALVAHTEHEWLVIEPTSNRRWHQVTAAESTLARPQRAHRAWASVARLTDDATPAPRAPAGLTLPLARAAHDPVLVAELAGATAPPRPPPDTPVRPVTYTSGDLQLPAFLTRAPDDDALQPALIWLGGGHGQVLSDVWSSRPPEAETTARAFRQAGYTVLYPGLRGGHPGTGRAEGFLAEVDDVIAAAEHVAALPWVDPQRVYLAGHSTGGTLALLVAASTDRFAGVLAYGPTDHVRWYGPDLVYCDPDDPAELRLRSPMYWMHTIDTPTWVVEGAAGGNVGPWQRLRADDGNEQVRFVLVEGHDHTSVLDPVNRYVAAHWRRPERMTEAAMLDALGADR